MLNFEFASQVPMNFQEIDEIPDGADLYKFTNFLCYTLLNGALINEGKKVLQLLEVLASSSDNKVRYIISQKLCRSDKLPLFLARKLAKDDPEIARKIILYSPKLQNSDLTNLIEKTSHQAIYGFIAQRKNISAKVSEMVVEKNDSDSIYKLLQNKTARIELETYQKIISRYQHNKDIMRLIHSREELSAESVNELLQNVDAPLKKLLISTYGFDQISKIKFSRTSILGLKEHNIFKSEEALEIKHRIDSLYNKNQLGPLLILRQLCKGDLFSFIYSLSKITDIPFLNMRAIVFVDFDEKKFGVIYKQAALPESYYGMIKVLVDIVRNELFHGGLRYRNFSRIIAPKFEIAAASKNLKEANYLISLIKA
jgi:uncharacterized protein (DUF2336 family)